MRRRSGLDGPGVKMSAVESIMAPPSAMTTERGRDPQPQEAVRVPGNNWRDSITDCAVITAAPTFGLAGLQQFANGSGDRVMRLWNWLVSKSTVSRCPHPHRRCRAYYPSFETLETRTVPSTLLVTS